MPWRGAFVINQKKYFNRDGLLYDWSSVPIILSCYVLEKFVEWLSVKKLTFTDLINISPYEYNWYGEFLYFIQPFQIVPTDGFFSIFYTEQMYQQHRKRNNVHDIIDNGYIGICIQQGWVKDKIYKPSKFISIYKLYDKIYNTLYTRDFHIKRKLRDFTIRFLKMLLKKTGIYNKLKTYLIKKDKINQNMDNR
ncbi:hypothetical protein FACS189485_09740 [Spirochaetia bacterium]|nr:hypothetical protein FACS189485_09740 [Spirochaetia bacterium]